MNVSKLYSIRPIEWLLAILFIIAPLYFHPNIGGTGLRIPNNIVVWAVASSIGFYSLYKMVTSQSFYLPRYFLLILIFPIVAFFSGLLSGVEIATQWTFRILFIWGGVLFFFGLFQHKLKQGRIDRLLFMITIACFIHALVGIAQIIWLKDIPLWLPMNPYGIPTAIFQQINNHASFQVTGIIIALWLFSRPFIVKGPSWRFIFLLFALACGVFIVSYSGSRIAILGFVLAVPLLLISRWSLIKRNPKQWWIIAFIVFASISSASLIENNRGLAGALDKTAALNSGFSGSARLGIYSIAFDVIKEKPLFGHGIGSFVRVWQLGKPAFYTEHPNATLPNQRVAHPHNEIIFWLVEGGLVSGIGLFCLFLGVVLSLKKCPHSRRYAYVALLLPIVLHTQVELPFYISASHWFVFLFLLFAIMQTNQRRYHVILSNAAIQFLKILSIVGALSAIGFLSHSMIANNEFRSYLQKENDPNATLFPTAMQNPYFKNLATQTIMTALLHSSMNYNLDDNVSLFAKWGEQEVKYNPHIMVYKLTVRAHIHLRQEMAACFLASEGQTIYPHDSFLLKVLEQCTKTSLD